MNSNQVQQFINDLRNLSNDFYDITTNIRKLFHDSYSMLTEEIKYGGLAFLKNEVLIGGIFIYKAHISIEFSRGADFTDPHSQLEGKGKYRRHIKLTSIEDLKTKSIISYITQAVH